MEQLKKKDSGLTSYMTRMDQIERQTEKFGDYIVPRISDLETSHQSNIHKTLKRRLLFLAVAFLTQTWSIKVRGTRKERRI